MQKNSSTKIKTGIFVCAGVALLFLIIFLIGNQQNLFRRTFKLNINYRSVVGLQEGGFVRFAGIDVGTVQLINIINDTTVRVQISVQSKVKKFIKADSRASISTDGLMGDKLIQIMPGTSTQEIKDGGDLVAVNPYDMEKIMARVEKVGNRIESIVGNIDTLSSSLAGVFYKVNNGNGSLGKLLNSEKLSNDLQQTISSAKETVKNANSAAKGVDETMQAAQHNFLLRGYFKKKERKRIKDSTERAEALLRKKDVEKKTEE